jgi:hypothetical protein
MKLSEQETNLFYKLMWAVQYFVNCKLEIHPEIKNVDAYANCTTEMKIEVRKALFENIEIIDSFIHENPQKFSEENLTIVKSWNKFVDGNFYIERFLKKYTVFIQEEKVYGVFGLQQGLDEFIHRSNLPLYVNAILLPFKGKIIYDGFLGQHNIYFGGGTKRNLKETYLRAKQNNRIVDNLCPSHNKKQIQQKAQSLKNWKSELDELADKVKKLRGSVEQPTIYSPAFSLVKASVEFAQLAVSDTNDPDTLDKALQKVRRAFNKTNTVLSREEY